MYHTNYKNDYFPFVFNSWLLLPWQQLKLPKLHINELPWFRPSIRCHSCHNRTQNHPFAVLSFSKDPKYLKKLHLGIKQIKIMTIFPCLLFINSLLPSPWQTMKLTKLHRNEHPWLRGLIWYHIWHHLTLIWKNDTLYKLTYNKGLHHTKMPIRRLQIQLGIHHFQIQHPQIRLETLDTDL